MCEPCEHCNIADNSKDSYFKCAIPCNQAKQCYENDKKFLTIMANNIRKVLKDS